MQSTKLAADFGKCTELPCIFGVGNAGKVDFKEFLVFGAVARRVQHCIDEFSCYNIRYVL